MLVPAGDLLCYVAMLDALMFVLRFQETFPDQVFVTNTALGREYAAKDMPQLLRDAGALQVCHLHPPDAALSFATGKVHCNCL